MHIASAWPVLAPFVLLSLSNIFMTFAWYGAVGRRTRLRTQTGLRAMRRAPAPVDR